MQIKYSNNNKLQVKFTKNNVSDYNWLFLIDSFLEKTAFKSIFTSFCNKLITASNLKTFNNFDLFKYELFTSFINQRATSDSTILKNEKTFNFIFKAVPWKSTINNFQNNSNLADSYQLNQALLQYIFQFEGFLYSKNGFITLDFDAVDIETHWNQQGSCKHWYYKQTMFYGLCCSIFNWMLPIYSILRSWDSWADNWINISLDMILDSLISKYWTEKLTNVLFRWDSWFWSWENYSMCEQKWIKFLTRFKSNKVLQNQISNDIIWNSPYKRWTKIFTYKAENWDKERIIIAYNRPPDNISWENEIQFYCTNIYGYEIENYDDNKIQQIIELYHERGSSEHPFHDLKESFQSGWTNSTNFYTNSYKFMISVIAISIYTLFRNIALQWTSLVNSYYSTIARFIIDISWKIVKKWRNLILKLNIDSIKTKYFEQALINLNNMIIQV